MTIAYFDCFSGISGDMTLGALLNCGVDFEVLKQELMKLPLEDYHIKYETKIVGGISSFKVTVDWDRKLHQQHRHLSQIQKIIDNSSLKQEIKDKSKAVFYNLAAAEAKVHGTTIDKVHFHEVGAVDAIIDIVASVICLDLLGVQKIYTSSLPITRGFIKCQHGTMPCPAPATMELLKKFKLISCDIIEGEIITPTGAAILATLAEGDFAGFSVIDRIGYGAGSKDLPVPNLLRIMVGESLLTAENDEVTLLETNIDDTNPELIGYLFDKLFNLGVLDVTVTPVLMKKNRPGHKLSVMVEPKDKDRILDVLFTETSTFGIRFRTERRQFLKRVIKDFNSSLGPVGIKIGYLKQKVIQVAPEYQDCLSIAADKNLPLKRVFEIVKNEYYAQHPGITL